MKIRWNFILIGIIVINSCANESKTTENTTRIDNTLALYNCITNDPLTVDLINKKIDAVDSICLIDEAYIQTEPKGKWYCSRFSRRYNITEYVKNQWLLAVKLMNNPAENKRFSYDSFKKIIVDHRAELSKELITELFGAADMIIDRGVATREYYEVRRYQLDTILSNEGIFEPDRYSPHQKKLADSLNCGRVVYRYFAYDELKSYNNRGYDLYCIDFVPYDKDKPLAVIATKLLMDFSIFIGDL